MVCFGCKQKDAVIFAHDAEIFGRIYAHSTADGIKYTQKPKDLAIRSRYPKSEPCDGKAYFARYTHQFLVKSEHGTAFIARTFRKLNCRYKHAISQKIWHLVSGIRYLMSDICYLMLPGI